MMKLQIYVVLVTQNTFKKNKNSDDYVIALRKDDFKKYLKFFDSKVDFLADYIISKYKINFNDNIDKNNILILYSISSKYLPLDLL